MRKKSLLTLMGIMSFLGGADLASQNIDGQSLVHNQDLRRLVESIVPQVEWRQTSDIQSIEKNIQQQYSNMQF